MAQIGHTSARQVRVLMLLAAATVVTAELHVRADRTYGHCQTHLWNGFRYVYFPFSRGYFM